MERPRTHHYTYAHRWLPAIAWRMPDTLYAIMSGEKITAFLRDMWNDLGQKLPDAERLDGSAVSGELRRHHDYAIAIVTLPPPSAVTEAYFTAFVFGPLPSLQFSADTQQAVPVRYYTLEFGATFPALGMPEQRTVFGGWTPNAHLNMGTGPAPTPDAFFERICTALKPDAGDSTLASFRFDDKPN